MDIEYDKCHIQIIFLKLNLHQYSKKTFKN